MNRLLFQYKISISQRFQKKQGKFQRDFPGFGEAGSIIFISRGLKGKDNTLAALTGRAAAKRRI
jgi:hypothetical protein